MTLPEESLVLLNLLSAPLLGLILGSFVAAAVWRLPRGLSLWGRSACTHCGTALGVADLVPVLSWLTARGRCRHCHAPVSARYPLTELTTAALWTLCALLMPDDPVRAAIGAGLGTILLLASLIDWDHTYLPDPLTLLATLLALLAMALGLLDPVDGLTGAALCGGIALALRIVMSRLLGRTALGLGDVKLMGMAGLWLGVGWLPPFMVMSGVTGLLLAGLRRLAARDGDPQVPFGPALSLALFALLLLKWHWQALGDDPFSGLLLF